MAGSIATTPSRPPARMISWASRLTTRRTSSATNVGSAMAPITSGKTGCAASHSTFGRTITTTPSLVFAIGFIPSSRVFLPTSAGCSLTPPKDRSPCSTIAAYRLCRFSHRNFLPQISLARPLRPCPGADLVFWTAFLPLGANSNHRNQWAHNPN